MAIKILSFEEKGVFKLKLLKGIILFYLKLLKNERQPYPSTANVLHLVLLPQISHHCDLKKKTKTTVTNFDTLTAEVM